MKFKISFVAGLSLWSVVKLDFEKIADYLESVEEKYSGKILTDVFFKELRTDIYEAEKFSNCKRDAIEKLGFLKGVLQDYTDVWNLRKVIYIERQLGL